MRLGVSYRFYLEIFYQRETIELESECCDMSFIKQQLTFLIQKKYNRRVVALYIDEKDIKKFKIIT